MAENFRHVTEALKACVIAGIHLCRFLVEFVSAQIEFLEFLVHYEVENRERREILAENRPLRYCVLGYESTIFKAVIEKNEVAIKRHLRLSLKSFEEVANYSKSFLNENRGWGGHLCVTVFLYWLAAGASYRVTTGASFNVSLYTVRDIVHKCLEGFLQLLPKVIKYPAQDTYEQIGCKFNSRAGTNIFSYAVGAIDGAHVKVRVPLRLRDQYINRKLSTTIQVQAVCSSSGEFVSICVGYPGSVHDERVLQNSKLFKDHIFPTEGHFLLGDSGYKCRVAPISIITPFKRMRPLTPREERFNKLHSKARSIIECSFGLMKSRWRTIFDKVLQLSLTNSIKTITVACIMHNICVQNGIENEVESLEDIVDDFDDSNISQGDDSNYATEFRRNLAEAIDM